MSSKHDLSMHWLNVWRGEALMSNLDLPPLQMIARLWAWCLCAKTTSTLRFCVFSFWVEGLFEHRAVVLPLGAELHSSMWQLLRYLIRSTLSCESLQRVTVSWDVCAVLEDKNNILHQGSPNPRKVVQIYMIPLLVLLKLLLLVLFWISYLVLLVLGEAKSYEEHRNCYLQCTGNTLPLELSLALPPSYICANLNG